jgi:hypothetical protein
VRDADVPPANLDAIGITNQRETTVLWERATGRPVAPAIVWQDRRTAARCLELPADLIRSRTGLVPDPYFSATKLEWLLARSERPPDELAFGTVDSWLVWKLTGGRVHATDVTNASRTMLLDLDALDWDAELLELFGVDRSPPAAGRRLLRDDRGGRLPRPDAADRGNRRRSAGRALRPRLLRPGRGEGDVRDRQLRPRQRRWPADTRAAGAPPHGRRIRRIRARGGDPGQRRGDPVAPGRPRRARGRVRERSARAQCRLDRRRLLRPCAHGPRVAALGPRGAWADQRPDPAGRRGRTS